MSKTYCSYTLGDGHWASLELLLFFLSMTINDHVYNYVLYNHVYIIITNLQWQNVYLDIYLLDMYLSKLNKCSLMDNINFLK